MEFSPVTIRGAVIQVHDAANMPEGEWGEAFPWLVVCETHRYLWGAASLEGIQQMRDEPEHWCRECRRHVTELIGGSPLPPAKPSVIEHRWYRYYGERARRSKSYHRKMQMRRLGATGSGLKRYSADGERAGRFMLRVEYTWTDLWYATAALMTRGFPTPTKQRVIDCARENLRWWGASYRRHDEWQQIPTAVFELAQRYTAHQFGPRTRFEVEALEREFEA